MSQSVEQNDSSQNNILKYVRIYILHLYLYLLCALRNCVFCLIIFPWSSIAHNVQSVSVPIRFVRKSLIADTGGGGGVIATIATATVTVLCEQVRVFPPSLWDNVSFHFSFYLPISNNLFFKCQ